MAEEFTAKFRVDISDLKRNITEANKQIKLANATFKAETAGMEDWTKDADGLSSKLKSLKSVLESQKSILSSYREQLERQQKAYNENGTRVDQLKAKLKELADNGVSKADEEYKKYESALKTVMKEQENNGKAVDDLKIKLLNQQAAVGKTQASIEKYSKAEKELGDESKDAALDIKKVDTSLNEVADGAGKAKEKLEKIAGVFVKGLAAGVTAFTGAVVAGVASMSKATREAAEYADEINTLSSVTGMSTDTLQEYSYAAELVDVSLETLTKSMAKNVKSMSSAASGSGKYVEAYEKLGVAVTNADGSLRDSETVFWEAIDALGEIENETERDATAMQLFGKSAQELNPLIEAGSGKIKELAQEAQDMGAVLTDDSLDALNEFDDSMQKLKGGAKAAKNALGTVLLPQLQELADSGVSLLGEFTNGLNNANGDWNKIGDVIGKTVEKIADIILKKLPGFVEVGSKIVSSLASAVVKSAPKLIGTASTVITTLTNQFLDSADEIFDVGVDIILNLVSGLKKTLPQLLTKISSEVIPKLLKKIISAAPKLLKAASELWKSLIQAIPVLVKNLASEIPSLIKQIGEMLKKGIPDLLKSATELFGALLSGLGDAAVSLIASIPDVLGSIGSAINDTITGILRGIEEGFTGTETIASKFERLSEAEQERHDIRMTELAEERQSLSESKKSWDEMREAQEKATSENLGEVEYYEGLAGELQTLVDKNGNVKKGYEERADFIMGRLSEAFGIEIDKISDVVDENGKLKDSITEAIKEKKKQILLSAKEEAYSEAIKRQPELIKKEAEAQEEYNKKLQEYNSKYAEADYLYKQAEEARKDGDDARAERLEKQADLATQQMNNAYDEAAAIKETQNEIREQLSDTVFAINDYETAYSQDADKISTVTRHLREEYAKTGDAKRAELEDKEKSQKAYLQFLKDEYSRTGDEIYQSQIEQAEKNLEQTQKELNAHIEETKGKSGEFKEAGKGNAKAAAEGMNDSEAQADAKKYAKKIAEEGLAGLTDENGSFTEAGRKTVEGFVEGLRDVEANAEAESLMGTLAKRLRANLETELDIHSPSRVTERIGKLFVEGFPEGVRKNTNLALNSVAQLGKKIAAGAQGALSSVNASGATPASVYNNQKSINFTQNNYSPKPLSRIEIYRQSRNLLSLYGGNV